MHTAELPRLLERWLAAHFAPESAAHDIHHLRRVAGLAMRLHRAEGGDPDVVLVASYLHDLHRHLEKARDAYVSPADAESILEHVLGDLGVAQDLARPIASCIAHTEHYRFSTEWEAASCIEAMIVRDADNLDALGAIGVARAFVYGGAIGEPIWDPDADARIGTYVPGSHASSVVHHFLEKLLPLVDDFETKTGQQLARQRAVAMRAFLTSFIAEWSEAIPAPSAGAVLDALDALSRGGPGRR
jgi:uncharacterized protein